MAADKGLKLSANGLEVKPYAAKGINVGSGGMGLSDNACHIIMMKLHGATKFMSGDGVKAYTGELAGYGFAYVYADRGFQLGPQLSDYMLGATLQQESHTLRHRHTFVGKGEYLAAMMLL